MSYILPKITLVSVGRPRGVWSQLCNDYSSRLPSLSQHIVKEIGDGGNDTKRRTSQKILDHIADQDLVILLDERGKQLSSVGLAELLEGSASKSIVFVIGSSYGVDEQLAARADRIVGLSDMTLPHELARVMLLEQIYRANCILTNHPYHHS